MPPAAPRPLAAGLAGQSRTRLAPGARVELSNEELVLTESSELVRYRSWHVPHNRVTAMTAFSQQPSERDDNSSDERNELMSEIDDIERGLAATPGDYGLLLRAAQWGERVGRYDEACRSYLHAAAAAPGRGEPIAALSDMLRGQAMHSDAVGMLQTAIERMPERAELWCAIARVMADIGATDKADIFLNEALRLEPTNVTARLQRGALHRRSERHGGQPAR
jgi:cytochrome c-type biogenesis protein CcmH/NrfG